MTSTFRNGQWLVTDGVDGCCVSLGNWWAECANIPNLIEGHDMPSLVRGMLNAYLHKVIAPQCTIFKALAVDTVLGGNLTVKSDDKEIKLRVQFRRFENDKTSGQGRLFFIDEEGHPYRGSLMTFPIVPVQDS